MYALGPVELLVVAGICFLLFLAPIALLIAILLMKRRSAASNPNLQPCPDCGQMISIHAASCPHCGRAATK
jgi:hypothetical protein